MSENMYVECHLYWVLGFGSSIGSGCDGMVDLTWDG